MTNSNLLDLQAYTNEPFDHLSTMLDEPLPVSAAPVTSLPDGEPSTAFVAGETASLPFAALYSPAPAPLAPLAERLAAARPEARAALLVAAVEAREPLELAGADLCGIDLRPGRAVGRRTSRGLSVYSTPVCLDGANLAGARLSGASLAGVSLRRACLDGALLVGADLRRADLSGSTLRGAHLSGANLAGAELSYTDFSGASLLMADLSDASAAHSDWRDALLHATSLVRTSLRGADLRWTQLDGANLAGAELDGARFEGARLVLANLAGAHLSASTDFSYAFLYQARFDRTGLARRHLGPGIGEAFTDRGEARDTYRSLIRTFYQSGRQHDMRWAHRQAWRMATSLHRPDRARRREGKMGLRRGLWHVAHWLTGHLADAATAYGTSFARTLGVLALVWFCFALYFGFLGHLIDLRGVPTGWGAALRYSAAALTPMDAYPLAATSEGTRLVATVEGGIGMALLGALGYVAASRLGCGGGQRG